MDIIDKYKDIALSNMELFKLFPKANIILYPDMHKYNHVNELLGPNGCCFILYEWKENYGHWCCLFILNDGYYDTLEFFDPYGAFPDSELAHVPLQFRKKSNQLYPKLAQLMHDSDYELTYNEHKFQKQQKDIKTCGRWCAVRMMCSHLSLKEFKNLFKRADGDDLVTLITMWVNK